MSLFTQPISEIIQSRYSCRSYNDTPIPKDLIGQLNGFMASIKSGPLGAPIRFELAAAVDYDPRALQGLGTYGLIKNPAGFIIGAAGKGAKNLEDYGYGLETVVLYATSLGLATCWLGGNFTKHSFARKIRATRKEIVPAVASIGYPTDESRDKDRLRQKARSDTRHAWETLFFQSNFDTPLPREQAGNYTEPLEMLRLAPSAHNDQPWRVVVQGNRFHFYLQRTKGFGPHTPMFILLGISDLQRIDVGISMNHFDLAVKEMGLEGKWEIDDPKLRKPNHLVEYTATWVAL